MKGMPREAVLKRLLLLVVGGMVLVASKDFLVSRLAGYLSVTDKSEALFRFHVVMAAFGVLLQPLVIYFFALAWRIATSKQFPPPGSRVWKDTIVVRGRRALLRSAAAALAALVLLCAAVYAQFIPQLAVSSNSLLPSKIISAKF